MKMDEVKQLAADMGVSKADCLGFLDCLAVWLAKGYTLDQAIEKHMEQMKRLVNQSMKVVKLAAGDDDAKGAIYDALREGVAA